MVSEAGSVTNPVGLTGSTRENLISPRTEMKSPTESKSSATSMSLETPR